MVISKRAVDLLEMVNILKEAITLPRFGHNSFAKAGMVLHPELFNQSKPVNETPSKLFNLSKPVCVLRQDNDLEVQILCPCTDYDLDGKVVMIMTSSAVIGMVVVVIVLLSEKIFLSFFLSFFLS